MAAQAHRRAFLIRPARVDVEVGPGQLTLLSPGPGTSKRPRSRRRTGPCTASPRVVAARSRLEPVHRRRWLDLVADHPAVVALRADARASLLAVARELHAAAWSDSTTAPTWEVLVERTGRSRSCVARQLVILRAAGLLLVLETGSTPTTRPRPDPPHLPVRSGRGAVRGGLRARGRRHAVEVEGNRAAVYLLTRPLPDTELHPVAPAPPERPAGPAAPAEPSSPTGQSTRHPSHPDASHRQRTGDTPQLLSEERSVQEPPRGGARDLACAREGLVAAAEGLVDATAEEPEGSSGLASPRVAAGEPEERQEEPVAGSRGPRSGGVGGGSTSGRSPASGSESWLQPPSGAARCAVGPWGVQTRGGRRAEQLAVAAGLRSRSLDLRPISDAAVASVIRPFLAAGWGVEDLVWAIDHTPDGAAHAYPAAGTARDHQEEGLAGQGGSRRREVPAPPVRFPAAWLAWRLAPWAAALAPGVLPPLAARRRAAAARSAAAAAAAAVRRAEAAALAAAAVPPPAAFTAARAALRAHRP